MCGLFTSIAISRRPSYTAAHKSQLALHRRATTFQEDLISHPHHVYRVLGQGHALNAKGLKVKLAIYSTAGTASFGNNLSYNNQRERDATVFHS